MLALLTSIFYYNLYFTFNFTLLASSSWFFVSEKTATKNASLKTVLKSEARVKFKLSRSVPEIQICE